MSAKVHQLFAREADLLAAWDRYAELARAIAAMPELLADKAYFDRMLAAELEYKRLFHLRLQPGGGA